MEAEHDDFPYKNVSSSKGSDIHSFQVKLQEIDIAHNGKRKIIVGMC